MKRATNLSLSGDVLEAAKKLDINISEVCDSHLREVVRRAQELQWREDYAEFVAAAGGFIKPGAFAKVLGLQPLG